MFTTRTALQDRAEGDQNCSAVKVEVCTLNLGFCCPGVQVAPVELAGKLPPPGHIVSKVVKLCIQY